MWDLLLVAGIGFLGSFGHCVGMCGPLTVALSLSQQADKQRSDRQRRLEAPDPSAQQQLGWVNDAMPTCGHTHSEKSTPPSFCHESSTTSTSLHTDPPTPSLSPQPPKTTLWSQLRFHLLLNIGRLLSYTLVGMCFGAVGSALVESGQLAGVGSELRHGLAIVTGLVLIWFGLCHINPHVLPRLPMLSLIQSPKLHAKLQQAMARLSLGTARWTPVALGIIWGMVPCGFLPVAQSQAIATANVLMGGATMLAFGLGTLPSMVGIGLASTRLGVNKRHQLFQLGGWLTLVVGLLTLLRTGEQMVDYSGYGSLLCLLGALLARPLSKLWAAPLQYRRALGVGAFVLAMVHVLHTFEHVWSWRPQALLFMLPQHQWGVWFGISAVMLMLPLAVTSFDGAQRWMGAQWRRLHLLSVPALALVVAHCLLVGSNYLGRVQLSWVNGLMITALILATVGVMLARSPFAWSIVSMEKWYVPPRK